MTVEEIKAKLPMAQVVGPLRDDCRYLVICDDRYISHTEATYLDDALKCLGVKSAVFLLRDPDRGIRLLELKP